MLIVTLLAAATFATSPCGGPGPDASPGSTRPVVCVDSGYDYRLPAINEKTGKSVPGFYFRCQHVKDGGDTCVLSHRPVRGIWYLTRRVTP